MIALFGITVLGWAYALFWPDQYRLQTYFDYHTDHLLVFIPWTICWLRVFPKRYETAVIAAIVAELVQYWMPNHTPDVPGATASIIGVMVGIISTGAYFEGKKWLGSTSLDMGKQPPAKESSREPWTRRFQSMDGRRPKS